MIISNIIGGLGNQMFQFALGRAIANERNLELRLDNTNYKKYNLHKFELLDIFDIPVKLANQSDVSAVLGWRSSSKIMRFLKHNNMRWLRGSQFVIEPCFNYCPDILNVQDSCYLLGYWQSEKYFKKIESKIRHDFIFKSKLSDLNCLFIEKINVSNSVSLHIRRGDYITNLTTNSIHGVLPIEYYMNSIEYIARRLIEPKFFIFSDDVAWAKFNLPIVFPSEYIEHNRGLQSHVDMRLMSQCKHHIIANSTFSWWGAWLNPDPHKLVVAPRRWFANNKNSPDLIPNSWVKI